MAPAIGRALMRQLVELHGGSVPAASPGIGQVSEFTLRLQREVAAAGDRSPS